MSNSSPPDHASVLVERKKPAALKRQEQEELLGSLKERLYQESMTVITDTLRFRDIDPEAKTPDDDPAFHAMCDELGREEARKAYRVARMGWVGAKEQPSGVKVASAMVIGILKANAAEKGGARTLNIGRVILSTPDMVFEERDVE